MLITQTDPNKPLQCSTRPKARLHTAVLPAGAWSGKSYLGKAWMKVTINTTTQAWTVTVAFGAPKFSVG